jgi:CRISPR-associated protein Cmr6
VGGAIQLAIAAGPDRRVAAFDYKDRFRPIADLKREHRLADPPNGKTTQGLFYAAYGMDDKKGQPPRFHVEPGATWTISLQARATRFKQKEDEKGKKTPTLPIAPDLVLDQARAALWLLAAFGGVGSKGRKGFGSLELQDFDGPAGLADCEATASELRRAIGLDGPWRAEQSQSPSMGERLQPLEIETTWNDPWYALDQLGFAYQEFAQQYAHKREKLALGLPRNIHGPLKKPMPHQQSSTHRPPHQPPQPLRAGKLDRHASPVHMHVGSGSNGLVLRILALPSPRLPDRPTSRAFLAECLDWLRKDLEVRVRQDPWHSTPSRNPNDPSRSNSSLPRGATISPPAPPTPPKPINKGQQDRPGTLHRQNDRWTVRFEGDARPVVLINPEKLPPDLADGIMALFYVAEANKASIRARFDRLPKK